MSNLLSTNRLVFKQKTKLIELNVEFAIRDESGEQVGKIVQEGQSFLKKLLRFISSLDQFFTHRMSVYDAKGTKVLGLTRPAKIFKSKIAVADASDKPVGSIVQENMFGKIRFALVDASGQPQGKILAENWRAWNFSIVDVSNAEIGRITKTWEGLARTLFTTADNYVLEVPGAANPIQRQLMLAAAAGVDLALKQDSRGLN